MAGINKVIIVGRLGKDPEIRYTPSGSAVANFSVATSEEWKDKNSGEKKERTEWHRIVAFDKLGEICGKYLSKGRQVYVEGKLQTSSYEKEGVKRYSTDIIASNVEFLGSREGGGEQNSGGDRSFGNDRSARDMGPGAGPSGGDDDIPF
jgi:single-strand DNA-binding protein